MTSKQKMIAKLGDFEYDHCVKLAPHPSCSYKEGVTAAVSFAKSLIELGSIKDKEKYIKELIKLDTELRDVLEEKDFLEERIAVYEDYYWQLKSLAKCLIEEL